MAASARPFINLRNHLTVPFHSSHKKPQHPNDPTGKDKDQHLLLSSKPSTETAPQSPTSPKTHTLTNQSYQPAGTDLQIEQSIPGFTTMNAEEKPRALQSSADDIVAEMRKKDPGWKPGSYEEVMERLVEEEEKKRKATDRWYKIWVPAILLEALFELFFLLIFLEEETRALVGSLRGDLLEKKERGEGGEAEMERCGCVGEGNRHS